MQAFVFEKTIAQPASACYTPSVTLVLPAFCEPEGWWDNSFSFPWWCGMPDETISYLVDSFKAATAELKGDKE